MHATLAAFGVNVLSWCRVVCNSVLISDRLLALNLPYIESSDFNKLLSVWKTVNVVWKPCLGKIRVASKESIFWPTGVIIVDSL